MIDEMIDETVDTAVHLAMATIHAIIHVVDLATTALVQDPVGALTVAPHLIEGVIQLVPVMAAPRAGLAHVSTMVLASVAPPGRARPTRWTWLTVHHRI